MKTVARRNGSYQQTGNSKLFPGPGHWMSIGVTEGTVETRTCQLAWRCSGGSIEGQEPTNMQTQNNTGQGRSNKKKNKSFSEIGCSSD
jgi:hypothetical protein